MSLYSLLFGRNPANRLLLAVLDLTESDVGRFRDCYLQRDEATKKLRIVVYTRNGGGNRDDYAAVTEVLRAHPAYLSDADEDFDSTYASYVFKVPEAFEATAEELVSLGAELDVSPPDRFKALIENLQKGDMSDSAVKRAVEVGKNIVGHIEEWMKAAAETAR